MENSTKTTLSNVSKYKCGKISDTTHSRQKFSYLDYKSRKAHATTISFRTMMYRKKANRDIQFMKKEDGIFNFQYFMHIMISEFNINTRKDLRYAAHLRKRRELILSYFKGR